MKPQTILRIEGLGIFVAALLAYALVGGPWWLLLVLALAPDLSMLGYLAGPRRGSLVYNLFHTYTVALVVLGGAYLVGIPLGPEGALVWIAHIGADRALGYGLKYETSFTDTHLSAQPAPIEAVMADD